ncbi:MAG: hypothetical protein NT151_13105 [Acidobacteria bacterium]|nr:hypothetical protein [Acidobacteriota bacterium]
MSDESLQDRYAPETTCFGCGPAHASCRGTFVAVKPEHPGYQRWSDAIKE